MKKVKVLKEMPFAKVGNEFELCEAGWLKLTSIKDDYLPIRPQEVQQMIKDGWLEWVEEEKSLPCKIMESYPRLTKMESVGSAHLAKEHCLEVFDEALKNYALNMRQHDKDQESATMVIRKALEES